VGILSWIVLGGLAGWVASLIMHRNRQMGCIANIAVGVIGGVIGGWIMSLFGSTGVTNFSWRSFVVALLGAVVLLAVLGLFTRGRGR